MMMLIDDDNQQTVLQQMPRRKEVYTSCLLPQAGLGQCSVNPSCSTALAIYAWTSEEEVSHDHATDHVDTAGDRNRKPISRWKRMKTLLMSYKKRNRKRDTPKITISPTEEFENSTFQGRVSRPSDLLHKNPLAMSVQNLPSGTKSKLQLSQSVDSLYATTGNKANRWRRFVRSLSDSRKLKLRFAVRRQQAELARPQTPPPETILPPLSIPSFDGDDSFFCDSLMCRDNGGSFGNVPLVCSDGKTVTLPCIEISTPGGHCIRYDTPHKPYSPHPNRVSFKKNCVKGKGIRRRVLTYESRML